MAVKRYEYISLPEVVGKGYGTYWRSRKRYVVCKGSRASKKSATTAIWLIYHIMKHPEANALVVRKVFRTLKDSCYAQLKWAIHRLKVDAYWKATESPLELVYKPTGQKILFRGLDDPLKVASTTVDVGYLCWGWIEEAYEIAKESDFDLLDESLRGELPPDLWKQWRITFNPWNERHWLKSRFFDNPDDDTLALTTNYQCNEWLDAADAAMFERMKERNPRRYQTAGLGHWGVTEGLVFENWEERAFDIEAVKEFKPVCGLDFGYTHDPAALIVGAYDDKGDALYLYDELYERGLSNRRIADKIDAMGYGKMRITADSAEPKSIDELKSYGLRVHGAEKGKDSVSHGVQWLQDRKIIVHPQCVNTITELSNYTWEKDRFGKPTGKPIDDFNHLMDALRYSCETYIGKRPWFY